MWLILINYSVCAGKFGRPLLPKLLPDAVIFGSWADFSKLDGGVQTSCDIALHSVINMALSNIDEPGHIRRTE
jgi:hypothetical protein